VAAVAADVDEPAEDAVVVPDDDEGVTLEVTGTVKAVDDEGDSRVATVAITAAVDGKTVLARATARVRLPA